MSWRRALSAAAVVISVAALSACRQDMHDAPRYDPLEASPVFKGGASAQPLVTGTVARGQLHDDELLYSGKLNGQIADQYPFPITREEIDHGQQRFNIYCAPCHGRTGEGNGMVVQRGYRQAASLHLDRLRTAPAGYFFDVISNGFGAMPDYRAQIPTEDRWRIVAYIRALQTSHAATLADVPEAERPQMNKADNPTPATPAKAEGGHTGGL